MNYKSLLDKYCRFDCGHIDPFLRPFYRTLIDHALVSKVHQCAYFSPLKNLFQSSLPNVKKTYKTQIKTHVYPPLTVHWISSEQERYQTGEENSCQFPSIKKKTRIWSIFCAMDHDRALGCKLSYYGLTTD